jgi:hypothetical protein
LETWEFAYCVEHYATGRSSSVVGSHGGFAVCLCGRCTVHRVDCDGCEARY